MTLNATQTQSDTDWADSGQAFTQCGPWAMVPVWVFRYLSGSDFCVYVALRSFADRDGTAWPLMSAIAGRAQVSQRTVRRAITKMRDLDLIRTEQWHRKDGSVGGCRYYLRDLPPTPPASSVPPPGHPCQGARSPVTGGADTGDLARTDQTTNQTTNQRTSTTKASKVTTVRTHTRETATTATKPPQAHRTGMVVEQRQQNPETTPPDAVNALADAVIAATGDAGAAVMRSVLIRACQQLAGDGWTPDDLSATLSRRSWNGCNGGAVVIHLRNLRPADRRTTPRKEVRHAMCPEHPAHRIIDCPDCARTKTPAPKNLRDLVKASAPA